MKILFLLAEFTPLNVAGAYRPSKMVGYLQEKGHNPVVVTLPPNQASSLFNKPLDPIGRKEIFRNVSIYEIPIGNISEYDQSFLKDFFRVTDKLGEIWWPNLIQHLPGIIEKEKPDVLLTSVPPFSLAPLAMKIAKKFRLQWILDMRDAWSQWCVAPYRSKWHYNKLLTLEKECIQHADLVVATTTQTADTLNSLHLKEKQKQVHVIPNGYEQTISWPDTISVPDLTQKEKIIIGYVGSFYYSPKARKNMLSPWYKKPLYKITQYVPHKEDWLYRSPYFFFKALSILFKQNPHLKDKIIIEFVGEKPSWMDEMLNEFNLKQCFKSHGFVSHNTALEIQKEFDFFIGTSTKVIGKQDYSMGSKYYEYILFKKPIIGMTPSGVLRDFINKSGMGFNLNPDNMNESVNKLEQILGGEYSLKLNIEYLAQFNIDIIFSKYLEAIEKLYAI